MTSISPPTTNSGEKKAKRVQPSDDNHCIPLPIQSFLWRQTNPFLGPKVGKLHEASCVTFERVIVQNILHGLSPSLSDAIQSIPRWRLVKCTFPHVIECAAALLAERERNEDEKMSQSLVKMLYILHWMVLDSASECMDSDGTGGELAGSGGTDEILNQYVFPLNCIQLFIFLFAPLIHTVKEADITGSIRLENGLNLWQALWDNRQPEIVCFSAPVKPRKSQLFYVPMLRRTLQQAAGAQDIYMGGGVGSSGSGGIADVSGGIYLGGETPRNARANTFSSSQQRIASPTTQMTDTRSVDTTTKSTSPKLKEGETSASQVESVKKTIVSAVRSVSDYKKKKQPSKESFRLEDEAETFKFVEESSASGAAIDISDRAPLVQLKDICGATWPSLDLPSTTPTPQHEIVCEMCNAVIYRDGAFVGMCKCDKASSTMKTTPVKTASFETIEETKFPPEENMSVVDEENKSVSVGPSATSRTSPTPDTVNRKPTATPSTSLSPPSARESARPQLPTFCLEKRLSFGTTVTANGTPMTQTFASDSLQASYIDVAVLRCLFVRHWCEEGVAWALRFFYQKLLDISSEMAQKRFFRKRSHSVPLPKLKITFASASPLQSKTDLDLNSEKRRAPAWEQLKYKDMAKLRTRTSSKGKVAFVVEEDQNAGKSLTPVSSGNNLERRRSFTSLKQIFGKGDEKGGEHPLGGSSTYPRFLIGNADLMTDSWGSLARSATDSNISYLTEYLPEAVGSAPFIQKNGHLNLTVVLKAAATVTERRLSVRVCESVLSVLDVLLDLDTLTASTRNGLSSAQLAEDSTNGVGLKISSKCESAKSVKDSKQTNTSKPSDDIGEDPNAFYLMVNAIIRILLYLGCQHGCNDGVRSPQADFLRSQSRSCLARVQRVEPTQFAQSLIMFVETSDLCMLLDFFHAFMGFCSTDTGTQPRLRSVSRSSRDTGMKNDGQQQAPSYKNHFHAAQRGVEGVIVMTTFKQIVTRFVNSQDELRQPENMGLYSDVRSLMNFLQEYHGHPFRLVELSALVDAMQVQKPQVETKTDRCGEVTKSSTTQELDASSSIASAAATDDGVAAEKAQKPRSLNLPAITICDTGVERSNGSGGDSDSESGSRGTSPSHVVHDQRQKGFFKKPKDKHFTEDSDPDSSSPGTPRHRLSTEDTPIGSSSSPLLPNFGKKKTSKLQMALSILKSVRSEGHCALEETEASESDLDKSLEDLSPSTEGETLSAKQRAKRKISFKSAARSLRLLTKVRKRHPADSSDTSTEMKKDKLSIDQLHIPPRAIVNIAAVREGAKRFAFMLETCKPGTVPDAPLLAALLDLKAPVIARATIFLECAYFVHRCNKGLWPDWLRMNMPHVRISSIAPLGRGTPSGLRRANMMLRNAGKMFYLWAEAVGSRLEELMQREKVNAESMVRLPSDEIARKQLRVGDDLEDFLDEAIVNQSGEECPFALKFLACMLIFEVTSFLRDTFQNLPRSRLQSKAQQQPGVERLMSHRRWSVLSTTFNPSQSGSIQSIADLVAILHPTVAGDQRRISFCAQDEEESIHSSHSNLDETGGVSEKRKLFEKSSDFPHQYGSVVGSSIEILEPCASSKAPKHNVLATAALAIVEPARRLAQGRTKLLKGAASGGGSGSQRGRRSFRSKKRERREDEEAVLSPPVSSSLAADIRRKSLKLMRQFASGQSSSVDYPHFDPELGTNRGSFKRKQSVASNETSGEREPSIERPQVDNRRVSTESRVEDMSGATVISDQEEDYLIKNMPWLKTVVHLSNMFNFVCSHQKYCHPFCFERCYRQSHRLIVSLRKVYGEEFPLEGQLDRRKTLIESMTDKPRDRSMDRRKTSVMPSRRESALVRGGLEKGSTMHLKNLLIEKLENEEVKETRSTKKHTQEPEKLPEIRKIVEEPHVLKYLKSQVQNPCHSPLSAFLKSALIANDIYFQDVMPVAWELLLEPDTNLVASAAAAFIISSVKHPDMAVDLIKRQMQAKDPTIRLCSIVRFHVLWRNRFHVWLKMEEGAHLVFKVPPPGIDFTLPSPPIGQSQASVVDPPWMPHIKTKVQELTLKEEEDSTSQTIMTMTKTRRKQKQEIVKRAVQQAEERKSLERQQFFFLATPVQMHAAYEPALFQSGTTSANVAAQAATSDEDEDNHPIKQQVPVAQPLFPSCLCSVVPLMIQMLDDSEVNHDGIAVSEVVKKVVWSCLVEDCALFIRHFLEKLTTRDKQEELMGLLRKLIQIGPLPAQTAYTLLNYMIGFVMHYVRAPCDGHQDAIGMALSLIWMIIPSVQGLYFKDVKQTLKKEQCDAALLLTANVPMAKKVIIQGPEAGSIPSQFNILEDTQFHQILVDSLDYFGISDDQADSYFLVDAKTGFMHNPNAYVRDFYFFRRSFYPQLSLMQMNVEEANARLKQMAFSVKFAELGRVMLSFSVLRSSPEAIIPQRIYFLHEELTRLPAFPRKALEACFGMYRNMWGKELFGVDLLHKLAWAQLTTSMLRGMENPYLFGDLHLFINVINGVLILHCEDSAVLRHCMATFIEMTYHFKTIFSSNGFFLIMPTILRCYSQHQVNLMLCEVIEFTCKQFYILHRKPFLLQMFGSIAGILDFVDDEFEFDPMKIKARHLFLLLNAMQHLDHQKDSLEILSLVRAEKPLKPVDLCYKDDPDTFCILTDALASCVTICAYAPDSRRCYQMLIVMQAILPHYLRQLQEDSRKASLTSSALKHELNVLNTLTVEMKVLINCCDVLARNFSGPQRTIEIGNSTIRGRSVACESPQVFEGEESIAVKTDPKKSVAPNWELNEGMEMQREVFRRPRDALLSLAAVFLKMVIPRIKDLSKVVAEHGKVPDLLDQKSHMKLSEIAHTLLKLAPYDQNTMSCEGLQRYFLEILPLTDWSIEHNRSALNFVLRRVDKTFSKIMKKSGFRRRINWDALSNWLRGLYTTLSNFPYMAHLHFMKTSVQMCLKIIIGDPTALGGGDESSNSVAHSVPTTVLTSFSPPQPFCSAVIKLTCLLMQALGEQSFSLEYICSAENLGPLNERIEAVLCHIVIPIFLRIGQASRETSLRQRDLTFCLNIMLSSINPLLTKATLGPTTSLAAAVIARPSDGARQGSVSVTDRTTNVTTSASKNVRDSIYQTVFLALKIVCLSFEKKLSAEWVRIVRVIKDLGIKRTGGVAYWNFLEFALTASTPLRILLLPFVEHKLLAMKPQSDQESHCLDVLRDKVMHPQTFVNYSKGVCLLELATELRNLKEDLANRPLDSAEGHSRTPTILADLHSDSSSMQSAGRRQSDVRRASTEATRLSFSSKISRLSPSPLGKAGTSPQESIQSPIDDSTIMEETETAEGQLQAPSESAEGYADTHLLRHKTTLRLQRGSRRRSRRSLYRGREGGSEVAELTQVPTDSIELSSISRSIALASASRRPPRLAAGKKAQSLDQPTIRIGTSQVNDPLDWTVPRRQGAFRSRSRSHSSGDASPAEMKSSSVDAFPLSSSAKAGTTEKSKLL